MTVARLFPILRTRDLPALVSFYRAAFHAVESYRFEDVYVALGVGGGTVGIGLEPEVTASERIAIWLYVDDVDATYRAVLDAGGSATEPPADMPWGERVAQVRDIDGNPLYLGSPSG